MDKIIKKVVMYCSNLPKEHVKESFLQCHLLNISNQKNFLIKIQHTTPFSFHFLQVLKLVPLPSIVTSLLPVWFQVIIIFDETNTA